MSVRKTADESSGTGTTWMHIFASQLLIRKRQGSHKIKKIVKQRIVEGMCERLELFQEFQLVTSLIAKPLSVSVINLVATLWVPVKCRHLT